MCNKQNRLNQKIHIDVILIYNQADLKQRGALAKMWYFNNLNPLLYSFVIFLAN